VDPQQEMTGFEIEKILRLPTLHWIIPLILSYLVDGLKHFTYIFPYWEQ
jgi:hypothetical protein